MAESEKGYQVATLPGGTVAGWSQLTLDAAEMNPLLMWPFCLDVYDKMRREDAQVASVLRAVFMPVLRTKWFVDPAAARREVVEHVSRDLGVPIKGEEPVRLLRTRGRFSWSEHARLALLSLVYGHSVFEQKYRIDDGDGLAHLAKLAWRPPRTISEFLVARDGGLMGIKQHGLTGQDIRLDVGRLVVYCNEREGGNWLGQSILRPGYKNWLLKDRELRAQALTIERNGLGIPVYTGAEPHKDASVEQRAEYEKSEREAGLEIAKDLRAGETAGASIPHGADLSLKGVDGRLPETEKPIRYHDEQLARAVLAHFLNLGTETGSWALGSTFANFFTDSLNAVAMAIASTAQQHVVEDLVDANWGTSEPAPILTPATIGAEHPVTAEAIKALVEAGVLRADDKLESFVRLSWGLPAADAATRRTAPNTGGSGDASAADEQEAA